MNQKIAGALAAALLLVAPAGRAQGGPVDGDVVDSSYDAPDGRRVLRQSIVVPATAEKVWELFTTDAGWRKLGVAFARVDLKVGGLVETSYQAGAKAGDPANIKNRVLAYLPLRMLALQAEQAPPNFPAPELLPHLFSVFEFDDLGEGRVRITVSGVGYKKEPAYERLYKFFEAGNAWTLRKLRATLLKGG